MEAHRKPLEEFTCTQIAFHASVQTVSVPPKAVTDPILLTSWPFRHVFVRHLGNFMLSALPDIKLSPPAGRVLASY